MSITLERSKVIDFLQAYVAPTPSNYLGLSIEVDVATDIIAAQTSKLKA